MLSVKVLFRRGQCTKGEQERLGVRVRSKTGGENKRRSQGRRGTDGTAASTYVLCHHVYTCPNLPGGQYLTKGVTWEGRKTKSVGGGCYDPIRLHQHVLHPGLRNPRHSRPTPIRS